MSWPFHEGCWAKGCRRMIDGGRIFCDEHVGMQKPEPVGHRYCYSPTCPEPPLSDGAYCQVHAEQVREWREVMRHPLPMPRHPSSWPVCGTSGPLTNTTVSGTTTDEPRHHTATEIREYITQGVIEGNAVVKQWWKDATMPGQPTYQEMTTIYMTEPETLGTPKAQAEAKCAPILEWDEDTRAYLYVLLHEGQGLRLESCLARLRRLRWR